MDNLVAHVQALEADNEQLRQALRQRNAQIRMLRTPAASSRRETPLAPTRPAPAAAPVFLGNVPFRRSYPASPPPRQQPWQVPGSPGQPAARSWALSGQAVTCGLTRPEPLWHGVGAPWGAAAAPGSSAGGRADAPQLGQPLSHGCGSSPSGLSRADLDLVWSRSLSASGLSSVPHPSFDRHCVSRPLRLVPPSSHAHPVHDLDTPSPFGVPTRAMIRERASSCSDLPLRGPAVESVGGTRRSGQLLRSQSGSYPQTLWHVPAHVDNHAATSATDNSFLLPPASPDDLEQIDFSSFWRGLA